MKATITDPSDREVTFTLTESEARILRTVLGGPLKNVHENFASTIVTAFQTLSEVV